MSTTVLASYIVDQCVPELLDIDIADVIILHDALKDIKPRKFGVSLEVNMQHRLNWFIENRHLQPLVKYYSPKFKKALKTIQKEYNLPYSKSKYLLSEYLQEKQTEYGIDTSQIGIAHLILMKILCERLDSVISMPSGETLNQVVIEYLIDDALEHKIKTLYRISSEGWEIKYIDEDRIVIKIEDDQLINSFPDSLQSPHSMTIISSKLTELPEMAYNSDKIKISTEELIKLPNTDNLPTQTTILSKNFIYSTA